MKKNILCLLILFFCLVFVNSVGAKSQKQAVEKVDKKQKMECCKKQGSKSTNSDVESGYEGVSDVYNKMLVGYKNVDLNQVLETIADTNDVVFIGSGSRNALIGKDEIKKAFELDFDTLENIEIEVPWISIKGNGNTAWLNALLEIYFVNNDQAYKKDARQTLVFKKIGNDWKIVSAHLSFPAIEVPEEEKAPVAKEENSSEEKAIQEKEENTPVEEIKKY